MGAPRTPGTAAPTARDKPTTGQTLAPMACPATWADAVEPIELGAHRVVGTAHAADHFLDVVGDLGDAGADRGESRAERRQVAGFELLHARRWPCPAPATRRRRRRSSAASARRSRSPSRRARCWSCPSRAAWSWLQGLVNALRRRAAARACRPHRRDRCSRPRSRAAAATVQRPMPMPTSAAPAAKPTPPARIIASDSHDCRPDARDRAVGRRRREPHLNQRERADGERDEREDEAADDHRRPARRVGVGRVGPTPRGASPRAGS